MHRLDYIEIWCVTLIIEFAYFKQFVDKLLWYCHMNNFASHLFSSMPSIMRFKIWYNHCNSNYFFLNLIRRTSTYWAFCAYLWSQIIIRSNPGDIFFCFCCCFSWCNRSDSTFFLNKIFAVENIFTLIRLESFIKKFSKSVSFLLIALCSCSICKFI